MTESICTYKSYLSGYGSLDCTFSDYLDEQNKLLCVTKFSFTPAKHTMLFQKEKHEKIDKAKNILGDIKVFLNLMDLPESFAALKSSYHKAGLKYTHLSSKKETPIAAKPSLLQASIYTCTAFRKTVSFADKIFFKPLKIIDHNTSLGNSYTHIAHVWRYLLLFKRVAKITSLSGKLATGAKNPLELVINIVISVSDTLLRILKMCTVNIHPGVHILAKVSKVALDLFNVYYKTV